MSGAGLDAFLTPPALDPQGLLFFVGACAAWPAWEGGIEPLRGWPGRGGPRGQAGARGRVAGLYADFEGAFEMRKLVVGTFLTLDGVMQAPGGPNEDREGDFEHGGWLVPYFDEKFGEIMTDWTTRAGAFLLGRKTYEIFAGSWPNATDPADAAAAALNTRPKYVASRTLKSLDWNHSFLIQGDVAKEVAKLKAEEGGEIQVHGSGDLLQTLLRRDLVDTLRIWQFPVVIGSGKRLFGEGTIPLSFRLVDTQLSGSGAVLSVYERAGNLKYGEVEVGQETVIFDQ
jgi:dihydrofolate reductase